MPLSPEQESRRQELERKLLALLRPGVRLEDVADILDARDCLISVPGHGRRPSALRFDVQAFVDRELGKLRPLKLPDDIDTSDEVLIPPDAAEVVIGQGEGRLEEKVVIPRTRYLIELLTEMNLDYSIKSGRVDKATMMRGQTYVAFFIPALKKIVLVCNEEGNRTFVVHRVETTKDITSYTALTKEELKDLKPDAEVTNVIWPASGDTANVVAVWKELVKNQLLTAPQPYAPEAVPTRPTPERVDVPPAPEGWMTRRALARELERSGDFISRLVEQYRPIHPGWFAEYMAPSGKVFEHLHPDLVAAIHSRILQTRVSPRRMDDKKCTGRGVWEK